MDLITSSQLASVSRVRSEYTLITNYQFQYQVGIRSMASSGNQVRTQELARKHGQSTNQKSNFKYLMSAKTNRTFRSNQRSKENEIQSVLMKEVHKFATKTLTPRPTLQNSQPLLLPLSSIEPRAQSSSKQPDNQSAFKIKSTEEFKCKSIDHENEESCQVLNLGLQLESKLQTQQLKACETSKPEWADAACMTQGCYYQKQLQIKIQLLQKERDDIWNRIASTLQENISLKQQVEKLTSQVKITSQLATQTDSMISLQTEVQTQITLEEMRQYDQQLLQLQRQVLDGQKSKKEIQEAKLFCITVLGQQQTHQSDLKSCIAELIGIKVLTITQQAHYQNQLKDQIHCQQIAHLKQNLDDYRQKLIKAEEFAKQSIKVRQNIESLYMKQMDEIKALLREKEQSFEAQINRLTQEFRCLIGSHEKQNKRYVQYVESVSCSWKQKQKLYSALLSEAHKTIRSLMAQMKEFQQLAYTNYSKYLQSQKVHILQLLPKDNDQQ